MGKEESCGRVLHPRCGVGALGLHTPVILTLGGGDGENRLRGGG